MKKITKKIRSSKNLTVEQMKSSDGTQNDRRKDNKKAAFTLAEVLITLAIVGVVAALTIPSLINKCQKIVWAKQAQETYAILTQAFKRILADNNTTSLEQTEVWSKVSYIINFCDNGEYATSFFTELGKYIKISRPPHTTRIVHSAEGQAHKVGVCSLDLSNGVQVYQGVFFAESVQSNCTKIKALGGSMCTEIGEFIIDINGDKGPNTYGRDIFYFYLSDEGVLYPEGGKDFAIWAYEQDLASIPDYWKNMYTGTKTENAKKNGIYRTGQLVEEGWKMNY